jgi:hypothetical protein
MLTKANDSKKEAKHYFAEYKSKCHSQEFDAARRKLEAAIALDPDEPLYLYELAKLQGSRVPPYKPAARGEEYYTVKRFMNLFEMFKESIEIYDRVAKRFPNYLKILYAPDRIQYEMDNIFVNLKGGFREEQRQYIRKVMKDYRQKAYPQMRKHYWKFDLSDGINSKKEYRWSFFFQDRAFRLYFFYDYEQQNRYAYTSTVKFLEQTRNCLKEHPDFLNKKLSGTNFKFWLGGGANPAARNAWRKAFENNPKLITTHPDPRIRGYGKVLAQNNNSHKNFTRNRRVLSEELKIKKVLKRLDISGITLGIMNKYLINFVAADNYKGHIYLLAVDQRQSAKVFNKHKNVALKIYDYDMKSGQLHIIWELDKYLYKYQPLKGKWKFCAMKDHLLITRKDQIIVVFKNDSSFQIIEDLPIDEIRDLTILNKRIYAFLGRVNKPGSVYALETMLMSCDLKGNDRKIHISTMKRDSKHFFDKQKAFIVSGLFADLERKRLLFCAENPVGGLWEYYPDTGVYKQLIKQGRNYSSITWGRKCGNKLYLRFGIRGKYYVYDLTSDKAEYLFFDERDKYAKNEKPKAKFQKYLNLGSQFITTDKHVWFADRWRVKCFERKNPICVQEIYTGDTKGSRNLFPNMNTELNPFPLREVRHIPFPLYPHPDGKTMILVTNHYIFELIGEKE